MAVPPESPKPAPAGHLEKARRRHEKGVASGFGCVYHPDALGRETPVAATAGKRQDDSPPPAHPADLGPERRSDADDNPVSRAVIKAASGSRSGRRATVAGAVSRPTPSEASDDLRTGAGTARPRRRECIDNRHARVEPGWRGRSRPAGRLKPARGAFVGWLARSSDERIDDTGVCAITQAERFRRSEPPGSISPGAIEL